MVAEGSRRQLTATAPAKLNLGLEIIGRRPDGFHEIRSIFQTVTICDGLTLSPASAASVAATLGPVTSSDTVIPIDDPGMTGDGNLGLRALAETLAVFGGAGPVRLGLTKGIPPASGLGGASSDAAAAILLAERWSGRELPTGERRRLAASLGSDVPFFLTGGTADVSGRGEHVAPFEGAGPGRFVVVWPVLRRPIERKTARLFAALTDDDRSDGSTVAAQVRRLGAGLPLDPDLLVNGFTRAIATLAPEIADLRAAILAAAGRPPALTGAGPSHYVVEPDPERAEAIASALRVRLGRSAFVAVCRSWPGPARIHDAPGPGSAT